MSEIKQKYTLHDYSKNTDLPVIITIDKQGVLIQIDDGIKGWGEGENSHFRKEVWVEFHDGKLNAHLFDGTQEDPNLTFVVHKEVIRMLTPEELDELKQLVSVIEITDVFGVSDLVRRGVLEERASEEQILEVEREILKGC